MAYTPPAHDLVDLALTTPAPVSTDLVVGGTATPFRYRLKPLGDEHTAFGEPGLVSLPPRQQAAFDGLPTDEHTSFGAVVVRDFRIQPPGVDLAVFGGAVVRDNRLLPAGGEHAEFGLPLVGDLSVLAYTPPAHDQVKLVLSVPAPVNTDLVLGGPSTSGLHRIRFLGGERTLFGSPLVHDSRLLPTGFYTAAFGVTTVVPPVSGYRVWPPGGNHAVYGLPTVRDARILPLGTDTAAFGAAEMIGLAPPQQVTFNGALGGQGAYGFIGGVAFVSHFLRSVYAGAGPGTQAGVAFISELHRTLLVAGWAAGGYGTHEATHPKKLHPLGVDVALYGTPGVRFNNVAFPDGVGPSAPAAPFVAFHTRLVVPFAQQYTSWGTPKAVLWQRHLLVSHPPESEADGELWGQYTTAYNRTKTVGMVGSLTQRISTSPAYLELTGRAIQPVGIDDGAYDASTFISHATRTVRGVGHETDRYPNNTLTYNTAATIRPAGFDALASSAHLVDRLLKYLTISGHRADGYGQPWASASPRTVLPVGSALGGNNTSHYVSHTPYPVQMSGVIALRTGQPFLFARPPITVYASWGQLWVQDQKQMGIPKVRRYPPLIEVPGRPYTEFSYPAAFVSHYTRTVRPATVDGQERWGTNVVRDRKFTVRVDGVRTDGYHTFRVENTLPDPVIPRTEYIQLSGGPPTAWGAIRIEIRWLVVDSLGSTTQFGGTVCQSNTIMFEVRHHASASQGLLKFGLAEIPGGARTITQQAVVPENRVGHPRTSPHHVYCTQDPPDGISVRDYKDNLHYRSEYMQWGTDPHLYPHEFLNGRIGMPQVLSVRPQTVNVDYRDNIENFSSAPRFGIPSLMKRVQEIYPPSFVPFRSGTSELRPYTQYIGVRGRSMLSLGTARVPAIYNPYVRPEALNALKSGATEIMLFNRQILAAGSMLTNPAAPGYNNLVFPIVGDWLRVYPSYDASEFGGTDVTNSIRFISPSAVTGKHGVIRVVRETQALHVRGDEHGGFGMFDNTREATIRPYSVRFFCPTSPYTQVMHA